MLHILTLIWEVEFWQCANYWGTIEGLNIPVLYMLTGDSSASLEESVRWAGGKSRQHQCCYLHSQTLWKVRTDSFSDIPITRSILTKTSVFRLVLPFERHMKGEDDRPLPTSKPRKPYKRNLDGKVQKAEKKRKITHSDREMDSEVSRLISISTRTKTVC